MVLLFKLKLFASFVWLSQIKKNRFVKFNRIISFDFPMGINSKITCATNAFEMYQDILLEFGYTTCNWFLFWSQGVAVFFLSSQVLRPY